MARYIRFKRFKQQINYLQCDTLNQWKDTNNYRIGDFYDVCESNCNCVITSGTEPIPQYRYIPINPNVKYLCENNDRYYYNRKEVSYDNGKSWYKVTPEVLEKGDLYEANSRFCTTSPELIVYGYKNVGEPYCSNGHLKQNQLETISFDGGATWEDLIWNKPDGTTYQKERSKIIEYNNCECGGIKLDYVFSGNYECNKHDENYVDNLNIISYDDLYGWTREGNTFKFEIYHSDWTRYETFIKIYFSGVTNLHLSFKLTPNSPDSFEVSRLDCDIRDYPYLKEGRYCGITDELDDIIMPITDTNEHFITIRYEFAYITHPMASVTLSSPEEETFSYEVWDEINTCNGEKTGVVKYRNSKPSYDCGYTKNLFVFDKEICGYDIRKPDGNFHFASTPQGTEHNNVIESNALPINEYFDLDIFVETDDTCYLNFDFQFTEGDNQIMIQELDVNDGFINPIINEITNKVNYFVEITDGKLQHYLHVRVKNLTSNRLNRVTCIITTYDNKYDKTKKYKKWDEIDIKTNEPTGRSEYRSPVDSAECE